MYLCALECFIELTIKKTNKQKTTKTHSNPKHTGDSENPVEIRMHF